MKECNKFIDSLILYYNPPDYNSLADYNSPDLISVEEIGIRKGWKAALEWVDNECESLDDVCCLDCGCFGMVQNKIDEELGDE